MSTDTSTPGTELAIAYSQELTSQFTAMVASIPETDDDDASERIVLQLLGADDVGDLNAPWDSVPAEELAGKRLRIDTIERRPSDFQDGLGVYLVCKGLILDTGEKLVYTTGAVSIVAQLVRAHFLGGLPAICELIIADRPTKKGYRPQHLKFLALGYAK
jgi:hypothetical protein